MTRSWFCSSCSSPVCNDNKSECRPNASTSLNTSAKLACSLSSVLFLFSALRGSGNACTKPALPDRNSRRLLPELGNVCCRFEELDWGVALLAIDREAPISFIMLQVNKCQAWPAANRIRLHVWYQSTEHLRSRPDNEARTLLASWQYMARSALIPPAICLDAANLPGPSFQQWRKYFWPHKLHGCLFSRMFGALTPVLTLSSLAWLFGAVFKHGHELLSCW